MIRRYLVIYTNGRGHLSGYAPDLPGCGCIGHSLEELRENLHDEIEFRMEQSAIDGEPIPEPIMGMDDVPEDSYGEWMLVKPMLARARKIDSDSKPPFRGKLDTDWKLFSRSVSVLFRASLNVI